MTKICKVLYLLALITNTYNLNAKEPFVVLNYSNYSNIDGIDQNNAFIRDSNYSTTHIVEVGDSLSGIIKKYYKNTGLNMRIVEISILEINRKAFVRNNPNYLFAGKTLRIPSVNEMMNLVKKGSNKTRQNGKHIYFFGGF
tara:strand:- start:1252 stop:1674 length:423 start_codon:yes stop_codon:yes gene_type:complete